MKEGFYLMQKVAKFYKVSSYQYIGSNKRSEENYQKKLQEWEDIKLPQRATDGSAGYDFFSPIDFKLHAHNTIKIPTGIRVEILEDGWFLGTFPKSGLGFKYRLQLDNTLGIIDQDYFYSDNKGHIFAKITNDTYEGKCLEIKKGEPFIQGIFLPFGITIDDESYPKQKRNGGFGSTNNS